MQLSNINVSDSAETRLLPIGFTIILLVLEELLDRTFDECYCEETFVHENTKFVLLLLIPSIISSIIAFYINKNFWIFITGRSCKWTFLSVKVYCIHLSAVVIWISIVFLDGDYIACTYAQPTYNTTSDMTCDQVSKINIK